MNKRLLNACFYSVMLIFGITNSVINLINSGFFMFTDLFYFLTLFGGIIFTLLSHKNKKFEVGAMLSIGVGLIVNGFVYAVLLEGNASIINYVYSFFLFVNMIVYVICKEDVKNASEIQGVSSIILMILMSTIIIYNLVTTDYSIIGQKPISLVALIFSNISLFTCLAYPVTQYASVKFGDKITK